MAIPSALGMQSVYFPACSSMKQRQQHQSLQAPTTDADD